jgi:DNA primase
MDKPDLLEYAQGLVQLKKVSGEYHGPCPACGGRDRFTIFRDGSGWMCRKCSPQSGGVFDLMSKVRDVTVESVMAEYRTPGPRRAEPMRPRPVPPTARDVEGDFLTDEWQLAARSLVAASMRELPSRPDAVDYLRSRGIEEDLARDYRLGYDSARSAIVIPWAGASKRIVAVKFRAIGKDVDPKRRFTQLKGGRQILFGGHLCRQTETCVVVEGEFNAISIRRAIGDEVDVVSFGGDTNKSPLQVVSRQYRRVLIWLDDLEKIRMAQGACGSLNATYLRSPDGLDANDILVQAGPEVLAGLVRARLGLTAPSTLESKQG